MAKITGRVAIIVNGVRLLNKAGAVASGIGPGDGTPAVKRTNIVGDTAIHGQSEELVPARLEVTITDRDDVSIADLYNIVGASNTVIFRGATGGKAYSMNNATFMEPAAVTAGEGDTPIIFEGTGWTETTV